MGEVVTLRTDHDALAARVAALELRTDERRASADAIASLSEQIAQLRKRADLHGEWLVTHGTRLGTIESTALPKPAPEPCAVCRAAPATIGQGRSDGLMRCVACARANRYPAPLALDSRAPRARWPFLVGLAAAIAAGIVYGPGLGWIEALLR